MITQKLYLVYDKQCPLCENYCQMVRIRRSVGELVLVDARADNQIIQEITSVRLDLDQGMVLKLNDNFYYGADAVHALSLISSRSGIFNRINYWIFCSKKVSVICYPILRAIRNLLLKVLSRRKINNLQIKNNSRF